MSARRLCAPPLCSPSRAHLQRKRDTTYQNSREHHQSAPSGVPHIHRPLHSARLGIHPSIIDLPRPPLQPPYHPRRPPPARQRKVIIILKLVISIIPAIILSLQLRRNQRAIPNMYTPPVPSRQQPNMVRRPRAPGRRPIKLARPRNGSEPAEERRRLGAVPDVLDVFGALLEGEEGRHRGRRHTLCGGGGRRREAAVVAAQDAPLRLRGSALGRSHRCPPCMRPSS